MKSSKRADRLAHAVIAQAASRSACLRRIVFSIFFLAGLSAGAALGADETGTGEFSPALVADPSIRSGGLANGLSFAVRENDDPRGRLYLRLLVKAGSLEESDDERGAAHFLEHMAFNGTRSFPKDELIRYMESIGMDFGAEVNASTGYSTTEYRLEVPTADPAAVDKAFLILREWADGILIDPDDVVAERGVVLEEERLERGAGERVWRKHRYAVFGDSRYAARDPIGEPEAIASMDAAKLRSFYERWYRPELMGVFAAGDLPLSEIESRIESAFSSLAPREGPQTAPRSVAERPGLRASVASDPELSSSSVELAIRLPLVIPT
ncbi:MAG: pitrilysin family protein, partial [Spirochaetaceae bacterium]|nr:pitrilysin family protein [Spirochaetaceae bacterium]